MIGPKAFPIKLVPRCCRENSIISIVKTIGIVGNSGYNIFRPSIAEEMEIAGVIKPSASNAEHPINVAMRGHFKGCFFTRAYKENIPPSPLLSALSVSITYLKVVMSSNVQMTQDNEPSTRSSVIIELPIMALNTYNGEVPISP